MVLLIGGGLMINSILRLQRVNPGFETANLLTLQVHQLPEGASTCSGCRRRYGKGHAAGRRFLSTLLEKTAALPGVESVVVDDRAADTLCRGYSFSILGIPRRHPTKAASGIHPSEPERVPHAEDST